MHIIKGTTRIGAIYKGTTPISAIYKGTNLIFSSYVWENYAFTNLYNSIIPSTISSKNVLDKAKLSKIYANGIVENQMLDNANASYINNIPEYISIVKTTTGFDLTCHTVGSAQSKVIYTGAYITGHKMFFAYDLLSTISYTLASDNNVIGNANNISLSTTTITANVNTKVCMFCNMTATNNANWQIGRGATTWAVGDTMQFSNIQIFDLTQMFGVGNEPTSTSDNRIKKLLSRGYIAYNQGEYKSTDISEIESVGYNLLSLNRTQGTLNGTSYTKGNQQTFYEDKYYCGLASNDYVHQTAVSNVSISGSSISFSSTSYAYGLGLPIKIIGGQTYSAEIVNQPTGTEVSVMFYTQDGYFISTMSFSATITAPLNAYWSVILLKTSANNIVETFSDICFHIKDTRTGYAPYSQPQTLQLRYQGNGALNSHDTLEITDTNWVFTKATSSYTFSGSESFTYANGRFYIFTSNYISNIKLESVGTMSNMVMENFTTVDSWDALPNAIWSNNGLIFFYVPSISDPSDLQTMVANKTIHYELTTPQVITIPRKKLAWVDLGTLTNWTKNVAYSHNETVNTGIQSLIKKVSGDTQIANIYCVRYKTNSRNAINNMEISINALGTIIINDSELYPLTSAEIQAKLSGIYLFYETADEVADITTQLGIESGGTLTSDSLVLPNVDTLIKCK